MAQFDTDICIIGAGPAGASTAIFLGKEGIPHVLLDAATFPRDKVCGDGLDLKVLRVLRHIDPAIVEDEMPADPNFIKSWGARIFAPNRNYTDFVHQPQGDGPQAQPPLWLSKRLYFDHFLLTKLNPNYSDFRQSTKVTAVIRDGQAWVIQAEGPNGAYELRSKFVIGADGDHSVVLRSLGERKIDRNHYAGTLRRYYKGVKGAPEKNLIELYFPPNKPLSYFYIFPLPDDEFNVGYGMVSDLVSERKYNLRDMFKELIETDPLLAPRFEGAEPLENPIGWGIPLASRKRPTAGPGYLLIGDAGSLVCPTSGEGIGTAMFSGFIAARFLKRAYTDGKLQDQSYFTHFDREVYRRLQDEIRAYEFIRRYVPWRLYDWAFNQALTRPWAGNYFPKLVTSWLNTAYNKEIEVNMM